MKNKTKRVILYSLFAFSLLFFVVLFLIPKTPRPNILFISADTLRADHLSIYGYKKETCPELKRFAEKSFVFGKAYATRGETVPSLASALTGLYPSNHSLRSNEYSLPDSIKTLPVFFNAAGYKTEAIISNSVIKGSNLTRDFQTSIFTDSGNAPQWKGDEKATEKALDFLSSRTPHPFFLWVHFMDPHSPYQAGPKDNKKFASHKLGIDGSRKQLIEFTRSGETLDSSDRSEIKALYDEEVSGTDRRVGRILAKLKKQGLSNNTIVVFFADHGEELGEHHNYFFHANSIYSQVLHVPLIWFLPEQYIKKFKLKSQERSAPTPGNKLGKPVSLSGPVPPPGKLLSTRSALVSTRSALLSTRSKLLSTRSKLLSTRSTLVSTRSALVSLIDIVPTITSLAGISLPPDQKTGGVDLTPLFMGKTIARDKVFSEYKNKLFGLFTNHFHYIYNPRELNLFSSREGSFPADPAVQKKLLKQYGRLQSFTVKKEELYDLSRDHLEQHSIAAKHKKLCDSFRQEINKFRSSIKPVTSELISEEARKNLKQKGY